MRSPSYSLALEIEDEIQVEEIQWQHRCSQLTKCMCLTTDPPPHQVLTSPETFFLRGGCCGDLAEVRLPQ